MQTMTLSTDWDEWENSIETRRFPHLLQEW